jgi:hypothetical protein
LDVDVLERTGEYKKGKVYVRDRATRVAAPWNGLDGSMPDDQEYHEEVWSTIDGRRDRSVQ